jgi:hypothetical protein
MQCIARNQRRSLATGFQSVFPLAASGSGFRLSASPNLSPEFQNANWRGARCCNGARWPKIFPTPFKDCRFFRLRGTAIPGTDAILEFGPRRGSSASREPMRRNLTGFSMLNKLGCLRARLWPWRQQDAAMSKSAGGCAEVGQVARCPRFAGGNAVGKPSLGAGSK